MINLSGIGEILIGIAAIGGVLVNYKLAKRIHGDVVDVKIATNGMKEQLENEAEARGFRAGHQEAEDEADEAEALAASNESGTGNLQQ